MNFGKGRIQIARHDLCGDSGTGFLATLSKANPRLPKTPELLKPKTPKMQKNNFCATRANVPMICGHLQQPTQRRPQTNPCHVSPKASSPEQASPRPSDTYCWRARCGREASKVAANSESLRPHCECRNCFSHNVFQCASNVTDDDFVPALGRVSPALQHLEECLLLSSKKTSSHPDLWLKMTQISSKNAIIFSLSVKRLNDRVRFEEKDVILCDARRRSRSTSVSTDFF